MISLNYIIKRFFISLALIFGVAVLTYIMIYYAPGDPALVWAGKPRGPQAALAIEEARRRLGLDQPLPIQLANYMLRFFSGDWGVSVKFKQPVSKLVLRSFMSTFELVVFSFLIAIPAGVALGRAAALRRSSKMDRFLYYFSVFVSGTPRYVFAAVLLLAAYAYGLQIFGKISPSLRATFNEVTGFTTLDAVIQGRLDVLLDVLPRVLVLAAINSTYALGVITRVVRVALSESFDEEYVKQAISLGLKRSTVVNSYAMPNVVPVLAQMSGLMISYSFLEAMAVEEVFGREGLGALISHALPANDYPLLVGSMALVALVFVIANTAADVIQALVDPRVQL